MIKQVIYHEARHLDLPYMGAFDVYKWYNGDAEVYFSVMRLARSAIVYAAAEYRSRRFLRTAIEEFCAAVFSRMNVSRLFCIAPKKSTVNLALNCGFSVVGDVIADGRPAVLVERTNDF